MNFCEDCGSMAVKVEGEWVCKSCNPEKIPQRKRSSNGSPEPRPASVERLPTTDSGSVRKSDAMKWLQSLSKPTQEEFTDAFVPKPSNFSGSTYPTSISNIRITGDPKFVETIAGLFKSIKLFENQHTRVEINLQKTEDRETGELTGNYALYLSVANRG